MLHDLLDHESSLMLSCEKRFRSLGKFLQLPPFGDTCPKVNVGDPGWPYDWDWTEEGVPTEVVEHVGIYRTLVSGGKIQIRPPFSAMPLRSKRHGILALRRGWRLGGLPRFVRLQVCNTCSIIRPSRNPYFWIFSDCWNACSFFFPLPGSESTG